MPLWRTRSARDGDPAVTRTCLLEEQVSPGRRRPKHYRWADVTEHVRSHPARTVVGRFAPHDSNAEPLWPDLEGGRLRVEPNEIASPDAGFRPRCRCTKSGWAEVPNVVAEWCEDVDCICHDGGSRWST